MPSVNLRFQTGLVLFFLLLNKSPLKTQAVTNQRNPNKTQFSARSVGRSLANCFSGHETVKCLQRELISTLEAAAEDNTTWHYSDILSFEKRAIPFANSTFMRNPINRRSQRSFGDELADKILHVAETRSLRFELPKMATSSRLNGISDVVDDLVGAGVSATTSSATDPLLLTTFSEEDFLLSYLVTHAFEGCLGIYTIDFQLPLLVLGFRDCSYFRLKPATVSRISFQGSLKKGTSGSSGSTTEHVIISGGGGGGGGHSHDSGWHRSMPFETAANFEAYSGEHESLTAPPISIEARSGLPSTSSSTSPQSTSASIRPSSGYYNTFKDAHKMPAFL